MVEDTGFKEFVDFAFPEYKMPSRSTITLLIEKAHEAAKKELHQELERVDHVSVTTDGWTSKYGQKSFTTVTLHYLDPKSNEPKATEGSKSSSHADKGSVSLTIPKPKRVVLETLPFGEDSHIAVNIHKHLNDCLTRWKVKGICHHLKI